MQALVFDGPRAMRVGAKADPEPLRNEVVVRISAAGVCGSELSSFTGASTRRAPGLVFGHELAGTVVALGDDVPRGLDGALVTINPLLSCSRCAACRVGRQNVCERAALLGRDLDGGFSQYLAVPATAVHELGALDDVAGSLVEPLANAVHVLRLLGDLVGRPVTVLGAGPIGLCVIAMLSRAGAAPIVGVDPVASRREQALAAGATTALEPGAAWDGPAPSVVVDAVGTAETRAAALGSAAPGATIVLLGLHSARSDLPVNAAILRELRLQASFAYTPDDFERALALLENDALPYRSWITELPLDAGQLAFETLVDRPGDATKIVLRPWPA